MSTETPMMHESLHGSVVRRLPDDEAAWFAEQHEKWLAQQGPQTQAAWAGNDDGAL